MRRRRPSKLTIARLVRRVRRDLTVGPKLWETMIAGLPYRAWHPIGIAISVLVASGEATGVGTEEGTLYSLCPRATDPAIRRA